MNTRRLLVVGVVIICLGANVFSPIKPRLGEISLTPAILWQLGPWRITNSLLCTWLVMLLLALIAWRAGRRLVDVPAARSLQNAAEAVCEAILGFMQNFGGPLTRAFFPVTATLFLYILVANWLSLIPGIGSIGLWRGAGHELAFVPLLRGATTDLNTTAALAISSVALSQIYGIRRRGFVGYMSRFLPLQSLIAFFRALIGKHDLRIGLLAKAGLDLFVGLLEIVEELTKILSFSFRLFGNVFGGEVLLTVMAFLVPYVATIPFIVLELLGGFIQALIFATLSTAFFARAAALHDIESDEDGEGVPTVSQTVTP
jgi:F-type H+-transporting ATPase subunit a